MTKRSKIALICAGFLLLASGLFLLLRDDVQQQIVQQELAEYAPSPQVIAAMEEKLSSLQTTSVTTTQTTKVTEFSHISTCEVKTETSVAAINTTTQTALTTTTQITSEAEISPEIQNQIAWLYIPETNINHPVMYSGDNEFYLHRAYDGSYLYAGSVFLDGRCSPDFSGTASILYGHHMNNGSMFADVEKFMDEVFFESHTLSEKEDHMKIYLKGYDYNDTLSTDFPMNTFQIQDTPDRMGGSTEVRFMISQFENMNLPQELCQKEFTANIYALNLFADRLEKMDSAQNAAFISVLKSHPESRFDEMLEMTFGLDSVPVLPCKDYRELGEIAIENELLPELESCPEELLELLDREKIGQMMCERDGGIFVQGYYCVPSAYEPPDIEISIKKPERCFFRLLAAPSEQQAEWATLPCEREKLFQLYDMNCYDFQSTLPDNWTHWLQIPYIAYME